MPQNANILKLQRELEASKMVINDLTRELYEGRKQLEELLLSNKRNLND